MTQGTFITFLLCSLKFEQMRAGDDFWTRLPVLIRPIIVFNSIFLLHFINMQCISLVFLDFIWFILPTFPMEHSNSCIHSPHVCRYLKPQFLHDYTTEHLKIYARASSNYVLNTCKI